MCYAIPGRVKALHDNVAIVDYFGEEKRALNELDDLAPGDYIYAQGGYVIEKILPKEAQAILATWKEVFFQLQETDLRLSRLDFEKEGVEKRLLRILDKALEHITLTRTEVAYLFSVKSQKALELIGKTANFLRQKYLKNSCCVHGIIEISNHCVQRCTYCGISQHNTTLPRYRMSVDEIISTAVRAVKEYGFKALVLQGGEDPAYSQDELCKIVRSIKEEAHVLISISFGEIGIEALKKLYDAGARALLMRFETSNKKLYRSIRPGKDLDERLLHIRKAEEFGYLIMTGALIGIPGQTKDDIINDIYLAKELKAEMYSFGPFIPHPATPLAKSVPCNGVDVLNTLAMIRFIDPLRAKILITTAFETLQHDAREKGLLAGANSVMLNVTPIAKRQAYAIYPDRMYQATDVGIQINETLSLLRGLGRAPTDLGVHLVP